VITPVAARVQTLEPRVLLTAAPIGSEFQVNTYTVGAQRTLPESPQSVATDADGDYVVTWTSDAQDGSNDGIYAQRYNAAGVAQGSEFRVNTYMTSFQRYSTVAMDADGDFVITWSSTAQDGSGGGTYAQRYNAAGVAQGSEFRVNTHTTNAQIESTVAMDADGDFVVTWASFGQDGDAYGIYAQRYNAAGAAQGSEFQVNTFTTGTQRYSTVAMDADGDFVVTWSSSGNQDGDQYGVYAQRYNAAGVAQGSEFRVNTYTTNVQRFSTVAMDANGDFVVTWSSSTQDDGTFFGVYAQRYNAAGVAQGGEFRVNTYTTQSQRFSRVAMDADGDFVVTWTSFSQDGSDYGIYAQRYNAAGVAQGSEFRANTYTTDKQRDSTVAMDADGDFVVVWSSYTQDGGGYGIYAQRYDDVGPDDADPAGPIVTELRVAGDTLFADEQLVTPPAAVTVIFSENLSTTGGTSGPASVTNPANWSLTKNGNDVSSLISSITFGLNGTTGKYEAVLTFSAPLTPGDYVLTAKQTITDTAGNALDGNFDGTPGGAFSRTIRVRLPQPQGSEFAVNTYTTGAQRTFRESPQSVAMDADGDYVVTWSSYGQDGDLYGVYAQRYNAAGAAQGSEFQVNTYTTDYQLYSTVAMDADGDFVVTWSSYAQDGNNYGIYAQRYSAAGVAQGSEFRANTYTTDKQRHSTVALDADGDFVVVWSSYNQDGDDEGVYAQRFAGQSPPVIMPQTFMISENRSVGHVVGTVVATDPDPGQSVTYAITAGNTSNAFAINAATGQITVNSVPPINFELNPTFQLTVQVTDTGAPTALSSSATVTVNLLDLNEAPLFLQPTTFTISENRPVGQFVGDVNTSDPEGNTVTYSIVGGDPNAQFAINATTGVITVAKATINFEATPQFLLSVKAQDNGSPANSRTQTITVNIANLNEAPAFLAPTTFTISENRPVGQLVGDVNTSDPEGNTVTYSLVGGNPNAQFAINATTGVITVAKATINFEATPQFLLQVKAQDNGSPANSRTQTITVNIANLNEAPTFLAPTTFTIQENRPNGTVVGTVVTTDPEMNTVTYSITAGNTNNGFAINAASGQIISQLRVEGTSIVDIAQATGLSRPTVYAILKRLPSKPTLRGRQLTASPAK